MQANFILIGCQRMNARVAWMLIEGGVFEVYCKHWFSNFQGLAIVLHIHKIEQTQRAWQFIFNCPKRISTALQAHVQERRGGDNSCSSSAQILAHSCIEIA